MAQKILVMGTDLRSLRSEVHSWGGEDGDLYVKYKPIELTHSPWWPTYKTVLEAIADGWNLMGPPVKLTSDSNFTEWEYWLSRND